MNAMNFCVDGETPIHLAARHSKCRQETNSGLRRREWNTDEQHEEVVGCRTQTDKFKRAAMALVVALRSTCSARCPPRQRPGSLSHHFDR